MRKSKQSVFVGDKFQMKSGLWLTVTGYITGKKIPVRFDESGYELIAEGVQIRRGTIRDWIANGINQGDKYKTECCGVIEVLQYNRADDIVVRFEDTGWVTHVEACQLKRGTVLDRLKPSVLGIGYLGDGPHKSTLPNGRGTWLYDRWSGFMERCYDDKFKESHPYYKDSTASSEWHNFQNFAEWASKQVGYGNPRWHLDKDIIVKGNKKYSAETCCFVPQELNALLLKSEKTRGACPLGLSWHTNNKYTVHVQGVGNSGYVGIYDDKEYAFEQYKKQKEMRIKQQANKWKDFIDPRAYEALMNYQVEITD